MIGSQLSGMSSPSDSIRKPSPIEMAVNGIKQELGFMEENYVRVSSKLTPIRLVRPEPVMADGEKSIPQSGLVDDLNNIYARLRLMNTFVKALESELQI